MQQFSGDIILEEIKNGFWKLQDDFSYENDYMKVTVKADFITDGASIPKMFWSIIGNPLSDYLLKPSIVHDGLYTLMQLPRATCDDLLKEMLLFNGVSRVKVSLIYYAVRLLGGSHWKKDTKNMVKFIQVNIKG